MDGRYPRGRIPLSVLDALVLDVLRLHFVPDRRASVVLNVGHFHEAHLHAALHRARRLEVGALFARALLSTDPPTSVRTAASRVYETNLARNLFLKAQTDSWTSLLARAGIPCRVLKGVYLSQLLHGDLGAKVCADVDILVRRSDLLGAMQAAESRGFRPREPLSKGPGDRGAKAYTLASTAANAPYLVDLHWELEIPMAIKFRHDDIWSTVDGTLDPDPLALFNDSSHLDLLGSCLCLHAWRHNMSLKSLVDFAAFVHRWDHVMPGVRARLTESRAGDGVELALRLVARVFRIRSRVIGQRCPKRVFLPWLQSLTHLSFTARGRYLWALVAPLRFDGFLGPAWGTARYLFRSGYSDNRPRIGARLKRLAGLIRRMSSAPALFTKKEVDRADVDEALENRGRSGA